MSIYQLINDIDNGDIVLPAIQRDFVWDEDRIYLFLDSILRGYPVGIALLWETYQPIQYRSFSRDYTAGTLHKFLDSKKNKRLQLVLDGQQRLSSLYVALRGTFNGNRLYLNILSGRDTDDHSEQKFEFWFADTGEIKTANKDGVVSDDKVHWVSISDTIGQHPADLLKRRDQIAKQLKLSDNDKTRMEINFHTLQYSLSENTEILKTQTIDAKLPADDQKRKTAFDILEIFVRVNTQGMTLKRSDLIVSMLRLYWPEASNVLPKFLKEVNEGNGLGIDNDFVIRSMFSVAGLGTRLDFELLRKKSNVDAIKSTYEACFNAIRSVVDFVRVDCGIDSGRLVGGINTLVPFAHYLFYAPKHAMPKEGKEAARKSLFLFAMSKAFVQHSESRTGAFIRDYLPSPEEIKQGAAFPYSGVVEYVYLKTHFTGVDHRLFTNNVDLSLALVQRHSGGRIYYADNLPEIDHIFPRSELVERGVDLQEINDIGNLWILPRKMNRNKSAKPPKKFLTDVDDSTLRAAGIDRAKLDYGSFRPAMKKRREWLVGRICEITDLSDTDFAASRNRDTDIN